MSAPDFRLHGLDHVQLAMPVGGEDVAREFYSGLLGLAEVPKPAILATRGGVWFEREGLRVHLGIEDDFRAAAKAHPAFLVEHLDALIAHLQARDVRIVPAEPLDGWNRVYAADPFGNRIELMEPSISVPALAPPLRSAAHS